MDYFKKKIYKQIADNIIVEDYLILFEKISISQIFFTWKLACQVVICITDRNELYITRVNSFNQFSKPMPIHSSAIFSIKKKIMTLINCPGFDGQYSIIRKYDEGRFETKEEFYQFLLERK